MVEVDSVDGSARRPVVLVTGGTSGIGRVACRLLVSKGYDVVFTCRSKEQGDEALDFIRGDRTDIKVSYRLLKLDSVQDVGRCTDEIVSSGMQLDYLLLNAGTFLQSLKKSEDGLELSVAVNHVGHFLFAQKLLPVLERTAREAPLPQHQPCITVVSSDLHDPDSQTGASKRIGPPLLRKQVEAALAQGGRGLDAMVLVGKPDAEGGRTKFDGQWQYKYSKLFNAMFAQAMHNRLTTRGSPVRCNSLDPGFTPAANLARDMGSRGLAVMRILLYKTCVGGLVSRMLGQPVRTMDEAALSEVYALTKGAGGMYYHLDDRTKPAEMAMDEALTDQAWQATEEFLASKGFATS